MISVKRILFPTDFSDYAENARKYAIELAKLFKAEIVVLHVADVPSYLSGYGYGAANLGIDQEILDAAKERLEKTGKEIEDLGINIRTDLAKGKPFVEVVNATVNHGIDLIVMATHGHGPVKHMLLGSTAEKVVQKAPCPVLTVKHPEHEFVHP